MSPADTPLMPSPATPRPPQPAAEAPLPTLGAVVARLSAEVAAPLTQALERVLALGDTGRIDRPGLAALRDEIDAARRIGLRGQQLVRLATGEVHPRSERLDLKQLLGEVLAEAAAAPTGAPVRWTWLAEVQVAADASLVNTLLRAASDWSQALARSAIDWRLDLRPTPVQARISCRFVPREAARPLGDDGLPALDESLDWLLLQYTAHIAGVQVRREDADGHTVLALNFPHTVDETLAGASALELGAHGGPGGPALLAGSQVLVLAARRELRQQVRLAMHGHDLFIDYAPTVAEAQHYCDDGLPQVLLYESSFEGEALRALRERLAAAPHGVALIELVPGRSGCDLGGPAGAAVARVGTEGLRQTLASVVVLELARRR